MFITFECPSPEVRCVKSGLRGMGVEQTLITMVTTADVTWRAWIVCQAVCLALESVVLSLACTMESLGNFKIAEVSAHPK